MDARNKYKKTHVANGLCRSCPEPAVAYGYCQRHIEKHRKQCRKEMAALRVRRSENNQCSRCGIILDPDSDSAASCINCNSRRTNPIVRWGNNGNIISTNA